MDKLNDLGDMILVTVHNDRVVRKDSLVGSYRIIPLVMDKDKINKAEEIFKRRTYIPVEIFQAYENGHNSYRFGGL